MTLEQLKDSDSEAKGEIDKEEKMISEKRRQKEHSDALINEIHQQVNELKLKMASLKERLNIEFNIELEEIMDQEPDPKLNHDDLGRAVDGAASIWGVVVLSVSIFQKDLNYSF